MSRQFVVDKPSAHQVNTEKRLNKMVRYTERFECRMSKDRALIEAADMAANGFGIDNIIVKTGVSRELARRLVLGI